MHRKRCGPSILSPTHRGSELLEPSEHKTLWEGQKGNRSLMAYRSKGLSASDAMEYIRKNSSGYSQSPCDPIPT